MADILYLKIDRNVQAKGSPVHLRDIAGLYCSAKQIENKVRTLRLPTEVIRGPGRYVFSVLDVIAVIQQEYPSLEIENLGETDFIITVEKKQTMPDAVNWGKTVFVCVLAFFGAACSGSSMGCLPGGRQMDLPCWKFPIPLVWGSAFWFSFITLQRSRAARIRHRWRWKCVPTRMMWIRL